MRKCFLRIKARLAKLMVRKKLTSYQKRGLA